MGASVAAELLGGLGSIALTIAVARTQSADALGVFAVVLATQGLLLGVTRSFTGDVFLFSRETYIHETAHRSQNDSTAAVMIIGGMVVGVCVLVAATARLVFASSIVETVAIGVALLALPSAMQQHYRLIFSATRRYMTALALDAAALAVTLFGIVGLTLVRPSVLGYLGVWALASASHAITATMLLRVRAKPAGGFRWLRSRFRGGLTFATDFAVTAGLSQFVILFISAIAGTAAAGALKAAQTLVTPVAMVMRGAGGPLASVVVRRVADGARTSAVRLCVVFSVLCFLGALTCILWLAVPYSVLSALLGESADPGRSLVIPTAFATAATGMAMGAGHFLRANEELRVATGLKLVCFPVSITGAVVGGLTLSAAGAQLGVMAGELLRAALAWSAVRRRFRRVQNFSPR